MFTVEFNFDSTEVRVLDDTGRHEEIIVSFFEDSVKVEQYNAKSDLYTNVLMSPEQWDEILSAMQSTEGAFIKRIKHG
tara:strand:- start:654 stop:887 length:234 start_codon:yes stop_codon:yes gene_type:complete